MILRDKDGKRIGQVFPVGHRTPGEVLQHYWEQEQERRARQREFQIQAQEEAERWAKALPGTRRIAIMGTRRNPDGGRGTFIMYEEKPQPPSTEPVYVRCPPWPEPSNSLEFMCRLRDRTRELTAAPSLLAPSPETSSRD